MITYRADWSEVHDEVIIKRGSRRKCVEVAKAMSKKYSIAYMVKEGNRGDLGCICYVDGRKDYQEGDIK